MKIDYFIARRLSHSEGGQGGQRPSVMVRIAALSVCLSLMVMILTMSIISGYSDTLRGNLEALEAHVLVSDVRSLRGSGGSVFEWSGEVDSLIKNSATYSSHSTFVSTGAIIRNRGNVEGVVLQGVDSAYNWDIYSKSVVDGALPRIWRHGEARYRDIMLSQELALRLDLQVGDRVEILTNEGEELSRDLYLLSGIYSTGFSPNDKVMVLVDIASVRRTMKWGGGAISGYQIYVESGKYMESYAQALNEQLLYMETPAADYLVATTLEGRNAQIVKWLEMHRVNGVVVVVIMLIVAAFNMATALLILVLERKRMVGILKSVGMDNGGLQRIFLIRSLYILFNGLFWGNLLGLGLAFLQDKFAIVKLDSSGYMIDSVPITVELPWLLAINIMSVVVILLLMIIPTRIVTQIEPCEAIK